MDQNNPTTPTTPPQPAAPSAPATPGATPSQTVVKGSSNKPGMNKKTMIMAFLLVVILVVLAAIGYYYYTNIMNVDRKGEITAFPSPELEPTAAPTESPDQITDESELDQVISDLDNSTEEANMTQEANGLQSDSNF